MAITQLSAFLENTPGTLSRAVSAISDAGVNLRALTVADTRDFGILRVIVSDIEKTKEVLSEDTIVTETKVIAVKMDDQAGALTKILRIMEEAHINIEYVYAATSSLAKAAYVVLRVNETEEAEAVLKQAGLVTLNDEDVSSVLG
ncbi:MAG: ACT domain-containing protein [Eubacteriales bacterium]|nr:ACT domain-containing protein [Sarcina sp.]MBE6001849.1 ACT domain-containing protein [Sarcina sp.]MBR2729650.1 ACT domain-containing protein [Lachnospiraceae bacterium]MBR3188336.1 ACT domain-containing protein [Lachnospiraceae bacterium]MDO4417404.1 ACT domain-containing protein [Eubacteriales bacterium]